ncbi:hypothetical protein DFS34DRAFT_599615 [Phlyctochytrium arcticum]|nr:hypothetical protein DFS34DRAFT_599615 [Phlyctochytrium arcticum]
MAATSIQNSSRGLLPFHFPRNFLLKCVCQKAQLTSVSGSLPRPAADRSFPPRQRYRRIKVKEERLKNLSGWEKIDLLRSVIKNHQAEEAVLVFQRLKDVQLISRLKYQDYHELLHTFLSAPDQYEKVIEETLFFLQQYGYVLSPNLSAALIVGCAKSSNLALATQLLQERKDRDLPMTLEICKSMLNLFLEHEGVIQHRQGIEFWNEVLKSSVHPDQSSYIAAMQLYGKLGQVEEILATSQTALHRIREDDASPTVRDVQEARVRNGLLSGLLSSGERSKALDVIKAATQELPQGEINKSLLRELSATFALGFKVCSALKDLESAEQLWSALKQSSIPPTVIHYGRMIAMYGYANNVDMARTLFKDAQDSLNLKPMSKSLMKLRVALLSAFISSKQDDAAELVYSKIQETCSILGKPMLKSVIEQMAFRMVDAGRSSEALKLIQDANAGADTEASEGKPDVLSATLESWREELKRKVQFRSSRMESSGISREDIAGDHFHR